MSLEIIIKRDIIGVAELTPAEREKAMLANPKLYPQNMPCMVCHFRWMQHRGKLCPARPGHYSHALGRAVPPVMGNTEFVPDENFYKTHDFDVV